MASSLPPPPPPPPPSSMPPMASPDQPVGSLSGRPAPTYSAESRWGLGDAWISMAVFFFVSLAISIVALVYSTGDGLDGAWLPVVIATPAIAQLAHILWVGRAKGLGAMVDFGLRFRPSDAAIGAGLAVTGMIMAGFVGAAVFALFDREPSAAVADLAQDSQDGGGLTLSLIALAVLAATVVPLVEELVYRGLWWSALEKRGMSETWVLLTTSGVFAVVHLELIRLPILFVLGLALGYGRIRTGRIGPCIAAHMIINGIGMAFLLADLA